jgi:hypothetical protein
VSLSLVGGAPVIDVSYYDPLLEGNVDGSPSAQALLLDRFAAGFGGTQRPDLKASLNSNSWLSRLLSAFKRRRRWSIAIAVGLCVLIGLGLPYRQTPGRTKRQATAADILAQSRERDTRAAPPHGAVHEIFLLEVHSGQNKTIGTAEVDSLRSADRPLRTLRLRTPSGTVLASHWIDVSGKVRDFSKTGRSKPGITAHALDVQDNNAWQHPPNAADFEQLAGTNRDMEFREVQDGYEVSFHRPASSENASIIEGHLVIATASMRPVAETLRVQDGEDTREYQFKELRYEILRPEQVRASDFIPDSNAHTLPHEGTTAGNAHLALQALQVLDNQPRNIQAAVDLERHPDESVYVTGVLPTRQEASSLTQSLRALQGGGTLRIDLHSADEPLVTRRVSIVNLSPVVSVATNHIPLDNMLRESLGASPGLSGAELDQHVQQAAREIVARSARVRRAAWVASQIGSRDFRNSELAALSAQDRQLWLALLERPLMTCDVELNAIEATLTGERNSVPPPPQQNTKPIGTVRELATAADSLRQNADRFDRLMVAGFALSPEVPSAAVSPAELLNQLSEVQREESRLILAVQRLQQAAPKQRNE